jgi:hypothetical protein
MKLLFKHGMYKPFARVKTTIKNMKKKLPTNEA